MQNAHSNGSGSDTGGVMLGFGKKEQTPKRRKQGKHPKAGSLYFQKGFNHRLIGGTARVEEAIEKGLRCSWRSCNRVPAAECRFDFIIPEGAHERYTPGDEITRHMFLCDIHTAMWVERHGAHIPEMISKVAKQPGIMGHKFWWAEQVEEIRKKRSQIEGAHPHDNVEVGPPEVAVPTEVTEDSVVALLEFSDGTVVELSLPPEEAQALIDRGKANGTPHPSLLERIAMRVKYGWSG